MQEMEETQVWSLGWEDSLEKEMAPYSNSLSWKIPWTEETQLRTFQVVQWLRIMKLEPIIQSEVSQKEKHKYSILTHIYGI